jgi:hypothetical protein
MKILRLSHTVLRVIQEFVAAISPVGQAFATGAGRNRPPRLRARFPFGWNHPNVKNSRQINNV